MLQTFRRFAAPLAALALLFVAAPAADAVTLHRHDGTKFRPGPTRWIEIQITANFDNTEQDSGFDLPANAIVTDAWLEVTTADTSETCDVGTDGSGSNDPDGFLDGASVNATGVIRGIATLTTGSNEVYFASSTKGALLRALTAGSDVATDVGTYYERPDTTSGGESVTFTCSGTTNTMRGSIWIEYLDVGSV